MKYVWKIMVRGHHGGPDRRQGYALAGSMREALEMAGDSDAAAIPQPHMAWPGAAGSVFFWSGTSLS